MAAIIFKQFSLAYKAHQLFTGLEATIKAGEFIVILGANGTGKSTLLRAILGLIPSSAGQITVLGKPVQRGCAAIGYMPQSRSSAGHLPLSGRTWLTAILYGYRWGYALGCKKAALDWVIDLVQAHMFIDRPFYYLSGGERQRLLLAQALLGYPQILLLDEPLMNLDPFYQENLVQLIQTIRQQLNVTVLFTSHDINPLVNLIDRVLYLARGQAVIGPVDEVITSQKLSALYNTEISVLRYGKRLLVINHDSYSDEFATHCQ